MATTKPKKVTIATKAPVKKSVSSALHKTVEKVTGLVATVMGVDGKAAGKMTLPKELFGVKVNKQLLAQAVRVFLANQRVGTAATKTRGQVEGSTRKIYRQKGTGRARHGAIRAPIFVGGGVVFGPTPRDYSLRMPQHMKRVALASALTHKYDEGQVTIVDGMETLEPKTKKIAAVLTLLGVSRSALLVVSKESAALVRAARNIEGLDILPATSMNPYAILAHKRVLFTKGAIVESHEHFVK